jgi:rubrerythrin
MGTKSHRRARGRAFSEDEVAVQDVKVQAERSPNGRSAPVAVPLDDSGFADFLVAGTKAAGEFRCGDCGYGAVVQRALPPCPMCGGTVWESRPPRFAD